LGSLDWGEDGGLGRGPLALGFLAGALGVAFLAFQQDAFEFGLAIAAALLFGLELSPELTCHAGHVNSADAKGVTGSVAQLKKSRKALHWLESVPRGSPPVREEGARKMSSQGVSRRVFLGSAAAATALTVVPRHVLGGAGQRPPSEVITRAVIGTGGMGHGHIQTNPDNQPPVTLAVCDVDKDHLASATKKAGSGCTAYTDFRSILDRKDIDTVEIATPPHWHALTSIMSAQAGMDVLCEKPMHRFIREGQAVIDAIQRHGRVFQIGTYGRFGSRHLRKLVASGLLGTPLTVRVGKRTGYEWKVAMWSGHTRDEPRPVPAALDYNVWLGPAPFKPYFPHRVHGSFRGYWDYDGGGLADMGQHYLDPITYWLDKDDTDPVEIEAYAPWPPHPDAVQMWGRVTMKYADGTTLILESGEWGEPEPGRGTVAEEIAAIPSAALAFIEGPKGRAFGMGGGVSHTDPPGLMEQLGTVPEPPPLIGFHDAVRTRRQPGGNASTSHRACCLMHLANIAIRLGRKLRYDPVAQQFPGDEEANRLVDVPMRAPWHL